MVRARLPRLNGHGRGRQALEYTDQPVSGLGQVLVRVEILHVARLDVKAVVRSVVLKIAVDR